MIHPSFLNDTHPIQALGQNIQLIKNEYKNTTYKNMNYTPINKIKIHTIRNHPSEMIYQLQESPPNKDEYAN